MNAEVPAGHVAIGEVGLAGEIRRIPGLDRRLAEAARLGFTDAIVPAEPGDHAIHRQGLRLHPAPTMVQPWPAWTRPSTPITIGGPTAIDEHRDEPHPPAHLVSI